MLTRRSFLTGATWVVAGTLLSAQDQKPPTPPPPPSTPAPPTEEKKLVDEEGREYRVCPQCAYNMYKQGRMWVCENCGYSYVE